MSNTGTGILWTGGEKILIYGVTFVQSVILARLLSPEDFGLTAMLAIFISVGGVLAESGLGTALVVGEGKKLKEEGGSEGEGRSGIGSASGERGIGIGAGDGRFEPCRGEERVERMALLWNVGIAGTICLALALAAPGIAAWYGKPILKPLLRVMSVSMVIHAASVVATARLQRELRFDRLAWVNGISTVVSSAVAIAMAWAGCGVWSIVGLGVCHAAVRTGLAWLVDAASSPRRDKDGDDVVGRGEDAASTGGGCISRKCTHGEDFRALLSYGWKLMASGLIHTAYCNVYQIVIGKMWSPAAVGLFVRGQRWAQLPAEVVNESVGRVALPKLAQGEAERSGGGGPWIALNALLLWPGLVVLWIWAPEIVGLVLGSKWLDCVPYMRIMILGQAFSPITNIALKVLYAQGRSDAVLQSDFIKKPLGLAALGVGCFFDLAGLCWAKVVSDVVECVTDVWYVGKGRRKKEEVGSVEPIDLVYCWYSGKIPKGVEKCRAIDNGELKRSLKTVNEYAPWFRTIYILVNDDTIIPEWLSTQAKVRIVRLSEFIPNDVLPINNSASIEMWLHHVPGLSERFVYGNDDMFFGTRVLPSDFFDAQGRMICRYKLGVRLSEIHDDSVYNAQLRNSRALLKSNNDKISHHSFDPYLKSVIEDFWQAYPEEARRSGTYRLRSREQLQRDVFALYAMKTGRGVEGPVKVGWRWISLYAELCDRKARWRIRLMRPKMYCLNDSERCTDKDRKRVGGESLWAWQK